MGCYLSAKAPVRACDRGGHQRREEAPLSLTQDAGDRVLFIGRDAAASRRPGDVSSGLPSSLIRGR
jgi:hypothetical protein